LVNKNGSVPKNLRAIIFDLDGTLRFNHPDGLAFFADYADTLGVKASPEKRRAALRWAHTYWGGRDSLVAEDGERLGFDTDQFWMNYSRRQAIALGASEEFAAEIAPALRNHMRTEFRPVNTVMPGVDELLPKLREMGYVVGVMSNRSNPCSEELEELGIAPYLDFDIVAGQVGHWKPAREVYDAALELAGVAAAEAIYVGDNYYVDVVGAKNAGVYPVLIDVHDVFQDVECARILQLMDLLALLEN
jgi:putative hydrolase of the HAD superfamily